MKKRIYASFLIIVLVAAAVVGGTMAWFTDQEVTENTFTAGTLIIDADDDWTNHTGEDWDNANPGDCEPKEFTITNSGSKNMYIRFANTGAWEPVNDFPDPHELIDQTFTPDDGLVTVTPAAGFTDDWTLLDGFWYYNGVLPPFDEGNPTDHILTFTFNVCLAGPGTTNHYQGASYNLTFTFDAIQVTHTASFTEWDAGFYNDTTTPAPAWYKVVVDGTEYKWALDDPNSTAWDPTGSGEPNWQGWDY